MFSYKNFLGKAIDPPKVQAIEKALTTLDELGATDFDGKLTALGRQMVRTTHAVTLVV